MPHGATMPARLPHASKFGMWSEDYVEHVLKGLAAFVKCYAFDIGHPHAQFLGQATAALRAAVATLPHAGDETRLLDALERGGDLGEALLTHRQLVYDRDQGQPVRGGHRRAAAHARPLHPRARAPRPRTT